MPVIQVKDKQFVELSERDTIIGPDGVQHPFVVAAVWSEPELKKLGVYRVARAEPPVGYKIKENTTASYKWNKKTGGVDQVVELEPTGQTNVPKEQKFSSVEEPVVKPKTLAQLRVDGYNNIDTTSALSRPTNNPVILADQVAKEEEAIRFLEDTSEKPNMVNYPYLDEAFNTQVDGENATAIAKLWVSKAKAQRKVNAKADARRIAAKRGIKNARSAEEIRFIVANYSDK